MNLNHWQTVLMYEWEESHLQWVRDQSQVLARQNVGFSAQAVQQIFPEAIGTDEDGYLNFNIHAILVANVNAIRELDAINKNQTREIEHLTNAIDEQAILINELMAQMETLTELVLKSN